MSHVFFIDRDLGRHIFPLALEAAGLTVERHDDHFPQDTPDTVWLRQVAEKGWVVVSGDQRILYRPLEIAAILESRALVLVLVRKRAPVLELAANFINTIPKIEKLLTDLEPPAIVKVYRPSPRELVFEGKPGRLEQKVPDSWTGDFKPQP